MQRKLFASFNRVPVQFEHNITPLQAGSGGRRIGRNITNQHPADLAQSELFCKIRRDVLNVDAKITADYFTVLHNLIHDRSRHIDRDGKTNSLISASSAEDSGI